TPNSSTRVLPTRRSSLVASKCCQISCSPRPRVPHCRKITMIGKLTISAITKPRLSQPVEEKEEGAARPARAGMLPWLAIVGTVHQLDGFGLQATGGFDIDGVLLEL